MKRLFFLALLLLPSTASFAKRGAPKLIRQLADPDESQAAASALIAMGEDAVPALLEEAEDGNALERRGWAIVCLTRIAAPGTDEKLAKIAHDGKHPMLVRTWAAAGRVELAKTMDEVLALQPELSTFPALGRPLGKKLQSLAFTGAHTNPYQVAKLLAIVQSQPKLQQAMTEQILALPPQVLGRTMLEAKDMNARRMAASYLATLGQRDVSSVWKNVLPLYRFRPGAEQVPWEGGPLYVPGITWDRKHGRELVEHLLAWMVWCDRNDRKNEINQINNNLRSINLIRATGMQWPRHRDQVVGWLLAYKGAAGKGPVVRILAAQGAGADARYEEVVK